jgi:hypothetical protein
LWFGVCSEWVEMEHGGAGASISMVGTSR